MRREMMRRCRRPLFFSIRVNRFRSVLAVATVLIGALSAFSQQKPATAAPDNAQSSNSSVPASKSTPTIRGLETRNGQGRLSTLNQSSTDPRPSSACLGDEQSDGEIGSVPDYVTYRFYFQQVVSLEDLASSLNKRGKDGSGWHRYLQVALDFSDEEAGIVRDEALQCTQALKEHDAKLSPISAKIASERFLGQHPDLSQMSEWQEETIAIINSHIGALRQSLGEPAFQRLDAYVLRCYKPRSIVPAAAHPASIRSPEPIGGAQ
jgi:hypothetical protein